VHAGGVDTLRRKEIAGGDENAPAMLRRVTPLAPLRRLIPLSSTRLAYEWID
jgi:hypothetical protein